MGIYSKSERKAEVLSPDQGDSGGFCHKYGPLSRGLLDNCTRGYYSDLKASESEPPPDLLYTRLQLNGSYKCVKCTKVKLANQEFTSEPENITDL